MQGVREGVPAAGNRTDVPHVRQAPAVTRGGLRPPHPHPGRACAARGSGPPTHPRMFFHVGAAPPRPHPERRAAPPPDRIAPPTPEAGPAPSPLAGEGGGEGERAQPATGASACGGTPQPTRHNPRPATQPQDPEWIVEGGCGGEPPLETTALAGEGGGEGERAQPATGQAPAGEPRSPPGTTPARQRSLKTPSGSSRGGVGGSPPLRQQPLREREGMRGSGRSPPDRAPNSRGRSGPLAPCGRGRG